MGSHMTIDEGQREHIENLAADIVKHMRHAYELAVQLRIAVSNDSWAGTTVKAEDLAPVGVDPMARAVKWATTYVAPTVMPGDDAPKWVSDNRCPEATTLNDVAFKGHIGAMPHAAHPYSQDGRSHGYWCDGFV